MAGLIETHGRRGTIVASVTVPSATRSRVIGDAARRFHNEVVRVGGTTEDAVRALRALAEH